MGDVVFFVGSELCHCFVSTRRKEYGVVAETILAEFFRSDDTLQFSLRFDQYLIVTQGFLRLFGRHFLRMHVQPIPPFDLAPGDTEILNTSVADLPPGVTVNEVEHKDFDAAAEVVRVKAGTKPVRLRAYY